MKGRVAAVVASVLTAVVVIGAAPHAEAGARSLEASPRVIATTPLGRQIVARHYGALDAPVQIVVIGQMHGSEPAGRKVVRELSTRAIPPGLGLWLIVSMNPDGDARGTRVNGRGVDLNRNFPFNWRPGGRGTYYPGPRAISEPETQGMVAFLEEIRPTAVLSYHQAFNTIDTSHPRSRAAARQLARYMGMQTSAVGCDGPCHGTMTGWIDAVLEEIAITIELPSHVSRASADRAATAVLRLGQWLGR